MRGAENITKESKAYKSGDYDELFTAASTRDLTMEEAVAYSASYYKELDNQSAIRFAAKTNYDKGVQDGFGRGIEKGILKIAANLKATGMTIQQICNVTGLTTSKVEKL